MTPFQSKLHSAAIEAELHDYKHLAGAFRAMLEKDIAEFGLDGDKRNTALEGEIDRVVGEVFPGVVPTKDQTEGKPCEPEQHLI